MDFPIPGLEIAGQVEVLNGTSIGGLARSVTRSLRMAGVDVVFFGTHRPEIDTTKILIRNGDSALAEVVRARIGHGVVESARDPRLLVDVTVLLGADFQAPEAPTQ